MKTLLVLCKLSFFLVLFSCKSKTIEGYWKAEKPTFTKAVKIVKNGNLYSSFHIISNNTIVSKNNMTIENSRLMTDYGNFEYIPGNDLLLDKSLANPIAFQRITEAEWRVEDSIASANLSKASENAWKHHATSVVTTSTKNKLNGIVQSIQPSGNKFIEVVIRTTDAEIKNIMVNLSNTNLQSEKITVGSKISVVGQWLDEEENSFEPSSITIE